MEEAVERENAAKLSASSLSSQLERSTAHCEVRSQALRIRKGNLLFGRSPSVGGVGDACQTLHLFFGTAFNTASHKAARG